MELFPDYEMPAAPLADRLRPKNWERFIGQEHLIGEGLPLRKLLDSGAKLSFIFWGPPGTGKTTLARIAARLTESEFYEISAVNSGVADIRKVIESARKVWKSCQKGTVLFIDEIHRFNKAQQDAVLPHIENGTFRLIGSTTENPSFELNNALLSRSRVYILKSLQQDDLIQLIDQAIATPQRGLGDFSITMDKATKELEGREIKKSAERQQFVMTSTNNLALLLSEILEQF